MRWTVLLLLIACGGETTTSKECPTSITRGGACSQESLSCKIPVPYTDCDGTQRSLNRTCVCASGKTWECDEVSIEPCRDAGRPLSTAGRITCGGSDCAVPGNYCCEEGAPPGPGTEKCVPATVSACGGLRRACDETADCRSGEACCIPPNANMQIALNAQCATPSACDGRDPFAVRMCKSNSDCPNNLPCMAQVCFGKGVQTCGGIPADRCK